MADRLARAPGSGGLTSDRAREHMVQTLRGLGIRHEAVLAAMSAVPRHLFVDQGLASRAYEDVALPIGQGQTISKPSTVAKMIELLVRDRDPESLRTAKVLEVGTGCGYQAAVLAHVFGEAVSIERLRWLHEAARTNIRPMRMPNLRLTFGDGRQGVEVAAPYDAIIVAAAGEGIPDPLLMQMKVGGTLIAPVASTDGVSQALHLVERPGRDEWTLTVLDAVRFVPLRRGTS